MDARRSHCSSSTRLLRLAAWIILGAATLALIAMTSWPAITRVITGQTPHYPEIQPQVLRYSPELVLDRAVETIKGLEGWSLTSVDREQLRLLGERRLRWLATTYQFDIHIQPHHHGSIVHMRSRSTSGRGDFGQNARNIRLFQDSLEAGLELARRAD